MIKRLISLIISISVIASLYVGVGVQAAEDYSLLSEFGVSIDPENLDNPITRIELAELAIQLTKSSLITEGTAVFVDIPQKHKYFNVVNTVYLNGLMTGYSDGTFKPEEGASMTDAGAMILTLLGYGYIVESADIPESQKQDIARSVGIYDGVPAGTLTNKGLGKMLLNMLDAYVVKPSGGGANINYEPSEETYLEQLTGYVPIEGIVQSVGGASIFGAKTVSNGWCMIDGEEYKCEDIVDMLQYLGVSVRAVVDEENGRIISVRLNKKIDEKTIDANDITEYQNFTYAYTENDGRSIKIEKIPADARIIFNGKNMVYDENLMMPQEGSVRFVNIDSDSEYDLVIVTSAVYMRVLSYTEGEMLSDSLIGLRINVRDADISCYSNGAVVDTGVLVRDKVIRVIPDKMTYERQGDILILKPSETDCTNIRIEILPESTTEGEITAFTSESLTIGEEEMEYSKFLQSYIVAGKINRPTLRSKGIFFKNENGKIIAFDVTSRFARDSAIKYGYLVSGGVDDLGENIILNIVNEQAQKETLESKDKLIVNGKKKTYNDLINDTTLSNEKLFVNGKIKRQLIGYELDKDGALQTLYIAKDYGSQYILAEDGTNTETLNPDYRPTGYMGYDNENFSLDYSTGKGTTLFRNGINHLYSFGDETVLFEVPKVPTKYEKYKVFVTNAKGAVTKNSSYNIKVYNASEDYVIGAMVIDYSLGTTSSTRDAGLETYGGNSQACMITKKVQIWDEEEQEVKDSLMGQEFIYSTSGLTGTTREVALNCIDPEYEDTDTRLNGGGTNKPFGYIQWKQLEEGDIILHGFDVEGNIHSFTVLFRYSELYNADGSVNYRDINSAQQNEGTCKVAVSKVNSISNDGSVILSKTGEEDYTKYIKGSTVNIGLYTDGAKKFEVIDISEVRMGDTVFTRSESGVIKEMFVFR